MITANCDSNSFLRIAISTVRFKWIESSTKQTKTPKPNLNLNQTKPKQTKTKTQTNNASTLTKIILSTLATMNSIIFLSALLACLSLAHAADTAPETNTQHLRTAVELEESAEPINLWSDFQREEDHRELAGKQRPTCTAGCKAAFANTLACEPCFTPKNCKQVNRKSGVKYCHDGCLYDRGASYRLWLQGDPLACVPDCTVKECQGELSGTEVGSLFTAKVAGSNVQLRWKKSYFGSNKVQLCFHNMHTAQCKYLKTSQENFTDKRGLVKGRLYGYRLCETGKKFPKCRRAQVTFQ